MGIPLLDGREFAATDDERAGKVAILNEAGVERLALGADPLDRRVDIQSIDEDSTPDWRTIVGIVGNTQASDLALPPDPSVYTPLLQHPEAFASVAVRSGGESASLNQPLRQALAAIDPTLPLFDVQSLEAMVATSSARPRFNAVLLGGFAGLALLLAAVGVYGVLAYGVTQRRREIGIRQAVGADRSKILKLVLGQGMKPVLLGLAVGVLGALAANRLLASLLFGVGAGDPVSWAGAVVLLATAGLVACWLPARQAVRLDPWTVLREE